MKFYYLNKKSCKIEEYRKFETINNPVNWVYTEHKKRKGEIGRAFRSDRVYYSRKKAEKALEEFVKNRVKRKSRVKYYDNAEITIINKKTGYRSTWKLLSIGKKSYRYRGRFSDAVRPIEVDKCEYLVKGDVGNDKIC